MVRKCQINGIYEYLLSIFKSFLNDLSLVPHLQKRCFCLDKLQVLTCIMDPRLPLASSLVHLRESGLGVMLYDNADFEDIGLSKFLGIDVRKTILSFP